jgi:thymidylate kinase
MSVKPIILVFLGIDGSGKTTQALSLNDYLNSKGYDSAYVWSRREPYISRIPAKLIKWLILKESEKTEGEVYLSNKKKRTTFFSNRLLRFFWINLSLLEYLFLIYHRVFFPNRERDVLICDRYLNDAIIDYALSCSLSPGDLSKILTCAVAKRFPTPTRTYFIDIEAELGAQRKSDGTSIAYLQDRVPMYRHVAMITSAVRIDGNLPLNIIGDIIRDDAQVFLDAFNFRTMV